MKQELFIGIDTSCYTTSLAVSNDSGDILMNAKKLLQVGENQRGLRQSEAVFLHIKNMQEILAENLGEMGQIKAVAASVAPRPQEGSYMPVFQVSKTFGLAIASAANALFIESTHQHAHIFAALQNTSLKPPFLAAHLSGGTSEMLNVDDLYGQRGISIVGKTLDVPAGQLVDRVGNRLGFDFPCGPYVEECAREGTGSLKFKTSVAGTDFHFSGVEAQAFRALEAGEKAGEVCRSVQYAIAQTISEALIAVSRQTNLNKVLLFGGVICNETIKKVIRENLNSKSIDTFFAAREYSSDNAAGLALLAREKYIKVI